jgi:ribulose-phosphate 3-epimerase|tara:strand:+ start:381 stop:1046 length:666 start_codon:yes stop_codon:yes gene_type:complete
MDKLSQVVPAILTDDPQVLKTMVRHAESFTNWVQIDIMDGQFVPSQSITYEHLANLLMKLNYEAHLMVLNPEEYLEGFKKAGVKKVVFHYEATHSPRGVISLARRLGLGVGLAINPDTPVSAILPLVSKVDSVLFLSVYPGSYGKEFIPEVLDKVIEFGATCPGVEIGIDGGIKEDNIGEIAQAGVSVIYVGSAIFNKEQPSNSYRRLVTLAQEGSRRQTQ